MADIFPNKVYQRQKAGQVCIAFGIRLSSSPALVQLAALNEYDVLWIELEHSVLSDKDASNLCINALLANVTPLVRVPYQCGDGYVQRVLDGGAMGVIFPHIHGEADAKAAVSICKYPPFGTRSMTGQLPQFALSTNPLAKVVQQANSQGSTVVLMIETRSAIESVESIAVVPGGDMLLVGSNDLSIELGVPGDFHSDVFRKALEAVSAACKRHGKIFGLAGIYDSPDIQGWAIHTLGVGFILAQQDSGWIAKGAKSCIAAMRDVVGQKYN